MVTEQELIRLWGEKFFKYHPINDWHACRAAEALAQDDELGGTNGG